MDAATTINLLFVLCAILSQNAQLEDRQRIQGPLVFAAKTAQASLLRLLADDELVGSTIMEGATSWSGNAGGSDTL